MIIALQNHTPTSTMKTITLTVLLTALIWFGSDSVFGASIGANFLGDGSGETALSAADSAGVSDAAPVASVSRVPPSGTPAL